MLEAVREEARPAGDRMPIDLLVGAGPHRDARPRDDDHPAPRNLGPQVFDQPFPGLCAQRGNQTATHRVRWYHAGLSKLR